MNVNKNKIHWDSVAGAYSNVWRSHAKILLSNKETSFIAKYLIDLKPQRILDIGVGNGRILDDLIKHSKNQSEIFGLDISENMVKICQDKFKMEEKIKHIAVCDVSQTDICFDNSFDLITAIRVLKYNKNWPEILEKIYGKLNKNGMCIFTMPNNHSITALHKDVFSEHKIPINYTNKKQLKKFLNKIGYQIREIRGFSKIPDIFYGLSNSNFYVKLLLWLENSLEKIMGKSFLARILFVVCVKE
jgi:ubiquinone/menaquinone biosynthesis C-methylase UbiE